MPATPDPRDAEWADPSAGSSPPRIGGSRHRAPDDGRRLMWAALTGAGVVLAVAMAAVSCSGGDPAGPGPAGGFAIPRETITAEVTDVPAEELSSSPSRSASPSPSARPAVRPADLLAGLQATLDGLVRDRQLRRDASNELGKRLREVSDRLAEGDEDKAREKLREFAEKLVNLRREDKIDAGGYEILAALTRQLAQALPGG
ncbi:FIMAH domain-containing protein [Micromonospora sp. H33]|uniref:FIMAH domain-containing protein n=1 Tax=Micromonospora sp. H33 TaxID=3452215 RepID=UPI003F8C71C1